MAAASKRPLRGDAIDEQKRPGGRFRKWWLDTPKVDVVVSIVLPSIGAVTDPWIHVGHLTADERTATELGALAVLGAIAPLVLAAVTLAGALRPRSAVLARPSSRMTIRDTWNHCLWGSFVGLAIMLATWVIDRAMDLPLLGWVAVGAGLLVVLRIGRALWVLMQLIIFSE